MPAARRWAPAWAAALTFLVAGAATELQAQYSRRTPIVEAVQKTRAAVVTIKAEKTGAWEEKKEIIGTGVIVDERGYLVTNRHVVVNAVRVRVFLCDGTELPGSVTADDADSDVAIVHVQAPRPLPALPFGPSSDLMVGETVIAIGHPFGYKNTVSTGIVSALDRAITMPSGQRLGNLIQTDTSINPGNSGGPLLNINGELIGIVVAVRDGAQGIAFAIRSDTVQGVLSRHLSATNVAGVRHGLTCKEAVAEAEGVGRQHLMLARVRRDTPAALAGLRDGDEIVRLAERPVSNRFDIERALWAHRSGDHVAVTVLRAGKQIAVDLTLAPAHAATETLSRR